MSLQSAALYALVGVTGAQQSVRDLQSVSNQVNKTQGVMAGLGKNAGQIGKGFKQVGQGLLRVGEAAGVAAAGGLVLAAKASIDFQDAFAGVRKTVSGTPAELDALDKGLRALSTRIPVKYTDLAGIAQEAGALGVASKDIAKFTEAVARTSAATVGLTTFDASEAFGKIGTIFKLSGSDFDRLGSALVALGNAGASSEGDIIAVTKRFAAAGSVAKLSTAQVLGWSSAIASLGPESEAAGSALSRTFNNITKYIGLAGQAAVSTGKSFVDPLKVESAQLRVEAATLRVAKATKAHGASSIGARQATISLQQAQLALAKAQTGVVEKTTDASAERLKVFAKVAGLSVAQFSEMYRTDASGAVDLFLTKLGKLDQFQSAAALKAAGIINVRDINAVRLLSMRVDVLNKQLGISVDAWGKNSDLLLVSEKRFDTLKSKLTELHNTIQVGAAAIGDGFTPALGRLVAKIQTFTLAHMPDFERFGRDIGAWVDKIDWASVDRGAQSFVDVMKSVLDIISKIPPQIDLMIVGFLGVNKVSGGLLGKGLENIVGGALGITGSIGKGLLRGLLGKVPVIGNAAAALTSTPVYVTNWPVGFGMGGGIPGAAAGAAEGVGLAEGGAAAAGLGLGTIAAGVAAGTAVAALGIMGLGWLITATSSKAQLDADTANALDAGRRRYDPNYGKPGSGPQTGGLSPDDRQAISDANAAFDTRSEGAGIRRAIDAQTRQDLTWDTRAEKSRQGQTDAITKLGAHLRDRFDPVKALHGYLSGIEKRSMAKYHWKDGKAPESWVQGTLGRDLIRWESRIFNSHQSAASRLAEIQHLERTAIANKDWGVAKQFKADIAALKAQAKADAKREHTATESVGDIIARKSMVAHLNATLNLKVDSQTLASAVINATQFTREHNR